MRDENKKDNNGDNNFDESGYVSAEVGDIETVDPFSRAHQEAAKEAREALPNIIQQVREKIKNVKGARISIGKEDFFVEEATLSALEELMPTLSDEEIIDLRHQFEMIAQTTKPVFDAIEIETEQLGQHILGDLKWFQKELGKEKGKITPVMKKYELGSLISEDQIKTAQTLGLMDDMNFEEALQTLETKNTETSLRFALNLIESAKEREGIESSGQVKKDMRKIVGIEEKTEKTQTPKRPNSSSSDPLRPSH